MAVFLFRHGEVDNPDRILYGRSNDFSLNDNGRQQVAESAAQLKKQLSTHNVNIVSSPILRTLETAEIIRSEFQLSETAVTEDERLIESYNYLEGSNMAGGKNIIRNPQSWKYLWNPFIPSWGEPYRKVAVRMMDMVNEIVQDDGVTILVSHELPIFITLRAISGRALFHNPRNRKIPLGSFHKVQL